MGVRQRLFTELFLLHNQVRDMAAQCDLLIWQVRASARLELIKEWLEGRTECWDPEEEYRRHLLGSEGSDHHFGGCPQVDSRSAAESRVSASEAITSTCWDFVFCRSEAGHYRVPVLHAALCRKPLSDLEDAGVGSIDGILRFAQTHSYLISDTRFAFSLSYHLLLRVGQDRRSLGPDPARDLQVLTCFWDERPCWRVPPSSAELCFFFGSRYRG
ncbi:hypothetical protein DY000_02013400 [Brassica cretica]|uniref:Uncharacterized protein n=1 Tax=Brassica cretica TaxID=69181 RepID=A0ABQ7DAR4_BRACR|nr:hypothetical protein DY000_02013400 [Brassica cretica]